ncbi:MAG TPA: ATP-binding protein [Acidimicrobiia bacterium]|nr:ATP-binding protein [Acidimicrobiia bacterium]
MIGALIARLVPEAAAYVGFVGLVVAIPLAVGLFYFRSKSLPPRERTAWRYIALGLSLFWLGVVVIGILNEMGVDLPAFGALDVFFLTAYVAMIVALYKLARMDSGGREWVLTIVDALVGGIALAALIWSAFFAELMSSLEGAPWWEVTIAAIYPVVDIVVVMGLIILVLRRSNYHLDLRLLFFALGGAVQVLGDLIFLSNSVGERFAQSEPAYYVNLVAIAFMLLSATIVDRVPRKREFPEAPTPIWALMWPYILAAVLLAVHFENYRRLAPGSNEILLLDAVILIGIVILVRQVYVIYRDRNRVDRKRAELVASVSHELRTPLTAMVGFLTLLDDHPDEFPPEARQEMIGEAAGQARHMSRLVSDLLVLARGDHTLLAMEREDVRAMAIVLSVLRNIDTGTTRIEEDLDAEVRVHVDPDRMRQALANLINNAVRYGGDRCLVVARVVGRDLIFEVHDNGEGVPTRYESIIWQHFERGAHRLDAVTPGLGIGLSIVQAVMEAHGGRADYRRSERLGGACFTLTVPGCVLVDEPALHPIAVG